MEEGLGPERKRIVLLLFAFEVGSTIEERLSKAKRRIGWLMHNFQAGGSMCNVNIFVRQAFWVKRVKPAVLLYN